MRDIVNIILGLLSLMTSQAQDITTNEYSNCRFLNIEEGLSGLQRHSFSSNGDTLAVIDNDSIFLYDIIKKHEITANELPFELDSETRFGGVVDFVGDKLVVYQVYFSTPDITSIEFAVFDEELNMVETSKIICGEYIFLSGFVGRIKMRNKELCFEDYGRNKEELIINKCTGKYHYIEHDRKVIYHNINGFNNTTSNYKGVVFDDKLVIDNIISFYNYTIAFCENEDNECKLVLLEKSEHIVLDKTYSNCYDCGIVKLFDSGFSWIKDGCFFQVKIGHTSNKLLKK